MTYAQLSSMIRPMSTSPSDAPPLAETLRLASIEVMRGCPPAAGHEGTPPPGTRIGRYTVLEPLGAGAMAVVVAAYDAALDRKVALKLVRTSMAEGSEARGRVQREAQALARVSDPNVVPIFEVGVHEDRVFVAMEHVEGITLQEWLQRGPHPVAETLRVFVQAGRGLVAAHRAGIIHRDFKPANVIVGRDGRARLVDFGLARGILGLESVEGPARPPPDPLLTAGDAILGTPAYMSPEQHRGGAVDERSDQFNFCAALFEALYGFRPFDGDTVEAIREEVLHGRLQAPPQATTSPALHAALIRGLAHDPRDRWSSLTSLLDFLERFDPARDPMGASAERRAFGLLLLGGILAFAAFLDYEALFEPAVLTPGYMVGVAATQFGVLLVAVLRGRRALLGNSYHRTMVQALLLLLGVEVVCWSLIGLARLPIGLMLLVSSLCAGATSAAIGLFAVRFFWQIAAVHLLAALLLAFAAAPPMVTATAAVVLSAALFVRGWDRAVARTGRELARPAQGATLAQTLRS